MTSQSQPALDQLVDELLINGFVVLEDLIPVDTIDAIYARCKPMMDRVEAWNSQTLKGERSTGQGRVSIRGCWSCRSTCWGTIAY